MYKFVKTQQRPTPATRFFFEHQEYPKGYLEYIKQNYIETGKLLSNQKTMSTDNMSVEFTSIWRSRKDFLSYVTDNTIYNFISTGNDYDIDNDIQSIITVTREPT
jgi:hypothetical protein